MERIDGEQDSTKADLQKVINGLENIQDINDEHIQILWKMRVRRSLPTAIESICDQTIFASMNTVITQLLSLEQHLEELEIDIKRLGAEEDEYPYENILIFLDYYLLDGGEKATTIANEIYTNASDSKIRIPFIVLMSGQDDVENNKDIQFRHDSGLLGGLFAFLHKGKASNKDKLFLLLSSWGIGSKTHQDIQYFTETVLQRITNISKEFEKKIRDLAVQDYIMMQHLSLHNDGHPFGDYLMWLYESYFSYLLRDDAEIKKIQKALDTLTFDDEMLPIDESPSERIAEMYQSAITKPVINSEILHPRGDPGSTKPMLQTGDIFISNDKKKALLVVNNPCDLAYSPGTQRTFKDDLPIFFIQGTLVPIIIDFEKKENVIVTDLFIYENIIYRIVWYYKKYLCCPYSDAKSFLSEQNYMDEIKARLRLPYTLKVQQCFFNNLSRIGMPVSPPLLLLADVEVWYKGDDNRCVLAGTIVKGAYATKKIVENGTVKEVQQIGFNRKFVEYFMTLKDAIENLDQNKSEILTKLCENIQFLISLQSQTIEIEKGKRPGLKLEGLSDLKTDELILLSIMGDFSDRWIGNNRPIALNLRPITQNQE